MTGLLYRFHSIHCKFLLANNVDPEQTPHDVASDLGLHCLSMALLKFPGNGLTLKMKWI